jgi:outer membrane beta-barrel protein
MWGWGAFISPAHAGEAPPPAASATAIPLDTTLKPTGEEEVSSVFHDMGVVQKKAMNKRHRFLVSTYATLDFSDGPYTNYSLSVNPGYAFSDFLEVYVQFSPVYLANKRSIVDAVEQYTLVDHTQLRLNTAKPKYQYGFEVLWAPLYGKDSLGLSRIIRSDTFFKLGASKIQYDITDGYGFKLGVGKTFFLGKSTGFRFCLDYGMVPSMVNNVKSYKSMLLLESGVNFYF